MKKCSTPDDVVYDTKPQHQSISPNKLTLVFLKQFARAYRPVQIAGVPGMILN